MKVTATSLEGVFVIEPSVFEDQRGFFMEIYNEKRYAELNIGLDPGFTFVQDNLSFSVQSTLRGLHFQIEHPQAKLVQVISGEIFDVAVDLRKKSSTFGKWTGVCLSSQNRRQLFIPAGFAHGFCVVSESALFLYKCSGFYDPADEGGLLWSDPDIHIDWPVAHPIISEKDQVLPRLRTMDSKTLPIIKETR
jgi:dTDP-4-dehydrorhamnose 3,5-epimerase